MTLARKNAYNAQRFFPNRGTRACCEFSLTPNSFFYLEIHKP
ncbi:hypothetical protein [Pseudomonas sp. FEN]|nr:hypothetical protein [Pseudomonas sp. FEN]